MPDDWRDYAFRLPIPGGRTVEAEVKGGRLVRFAATPRRPGLLQPDFRFRGAPVRSF